MSGAMRRIGEYLGLLEDTGTYDQYGYPEDSYPEAGYEEYDATEVHAASGTGQQAAVAAPVSAPARPVRRAEAPVPKPVTDLAERRRPVQAAPVPTVAELSRIVTLHPSTYNEARVVGENFRDGLPVIMNLSEMDDTDAKRLVDFAAGLVFATRGTIERVTNKVFLLSPPNVSVAAEDKQRIVEGGFFNQS